jgi:hypothetical protein
MSEQQQQQQPPAAPPTNAAEARVQLDTLRSNADWNAKLLAGSGPETNQWRDLHTMIAAGDNVELAMSGALPDVPDSQLKLMAGTAEMLKSMGFPPQAIRETLSGKEATQADVDRATAWKTENLKSKDFVDRLMRGEPDATRQLWVANVILSSPLKKENA